MPHGLEEYNGEASFAYNGAQNPWHKLGTSMSGLSTADAMLEAARADYTVSAEPLFVMMDSGMSVVPGRNATVRSVAADDTREPSDRVLGIVGENYQIIQNREVLERALTVVGADPENSAVVDTCGVLGKGERFFAYVDLGTLSIDPLGADDKITRGLGVLTSHDGTAAITYALSNVRWVCQNTVNLGLRQADRKFTARHTLNVNAALAEAHTVLGIAESWQQAFTNMAERLLRVNDGGSEGSAHDLLTRVEQQLWPVADEPTQHAVTLSANRQEELHRILSSNTCIGAVGSNGWAVYNAFVEYSDHVRPRVSDDRRAEAAMLGATDDWKDRVAGLVLA